MQYLIKVGQLKLNKFINPKTDGVVLPILHLNGYKIANPTLFARISTYELKYFFYGCGYKPIIVEITSDMKPYDYHNKMASAMEECVRAIKQIKSEADSIDRPLWPMIILKTPKGWTGPKEVNSKQSLQTCKKEEKAIYKNKNTILKAYNTINLFNLRCPARDAASYDIPSIKSPSPHKTYV